MTTFERFERDIPELMTELAPAQVPDYFDDMLRQTASKRQRPAWSYPERWLPMGVIARTAPIRTISWRPIAVLALLMLLIAAALFAYAGSGPKLPSPFGLARNGQIVFSDATGTIQAADPSAGTYATLVAGSETESRPRVHQRRHAIRLRPRHRECPRLVHRKRRRIRRPSGPGSRSRDQLVPVVADWRSNRPVSIRGRARHDHDRASRRRLIPNAAPWRQCPRCDVAPESRRAAGDCRYHHDQRGDRAWLLRRGRQRRRSPADRRRCPDRQHANRCPRWCDPCLRDVGNGS